MSLVEFILNRLTTEKSLGSPVLVLGVVLVGVEVDQSEDNQLQAPNQFDMGEGGGEEGEGEEEVTNVQWIGET